MKNKNALNTSSIPFKEIDFFSYFFFFYMNVCTFFIYKIVYNVKNVCLSASSPFFFFLFYIFILFSSPFMCVCRRTCNFLAETYIFIHYTRVHYTLEWDVSDVCVCVTVLREKNVKKDDNTHTKLVLITKIHVPCFLCVSEFFFIIIQIQLFYFFFRSLSFFFFLITHEKKLY